jgi:hypothetical protein
MTAEIDASARTAITQYHQALIKVLKTKNPEAIEDLSDIGEKAANMMWQMQRALAAHGKAPGWNRSRRRSSAWAPNPIGICIQNVDLT